METKHTVSAVGRKRRHYRLSPVVKHSVKIAGRTTSVTLESGFWYALQDIAGSKNISIAALIRQIDNDRIGSNLSSSIRLFVLEYFRALSRTKLAGATKESGPQRG